MRGRLRIPLRAAALGAAALFPAGIHAEEERARAPLPPRYVQECGSCHVAYPARFLSAASWRALLAGLDTHFGTDASLEPAARAEIQALLEAGASRRDTSQDGRPVLRITETRWFRGEHDEVRADAWRRPAVGSAANCAACHPGAEQGDYSEHRIRIPREGATR